MRGLVGVPDVGAYVTKQVGAIIGSQGDTMVVSAGGNMRDIATGWAGYTCSIKFLFVNNNQTAGQGSIKILQASYTASTTAFAGFYVQYFTEASLVTDAVPVTPTCVFNWQAVVVSI